jgi:hypothetical protein
LEEDFRFFTIPPANTPPQIPESICRLGTQSKQYASVLLQLSEAGSSDATKAMRLFRKACSKRVNANAPINAVMRDVYKMDAVPLNLLPGARWQLDDAGRLSLQLLIRIWLARRTPHAYSDIGDYASSLPQFNADGYYEWWTLARLFIDRILRRKDPLNIPTHAVPVKDISPRIGTRVYIMGKLRQRFKSFARKLGDSV